MLDGIRWKQDIGDGGNILIVLDLVISTKSKSRCIIVN